ncbi:MAG TPA: hypothetical protein VFV58_03355 [Blastocatellia bacterium]|nr:hypothetical protein [Blastocatellia bacterium]
MRWQVMAPDNATLSVSTPSVNGDQNANGALGNSIGVKMESLQVFAPLPLFQDSNTISA